MVSRVWRGDEDCDISIPSLLFPIISFTPTPSIILHPILFFHFSTLPSSSMPQFPPFLLLLLSPSPSPSISLTPSLSFRPLSLSPSVLSPSLLPLPPYPPVQIIPQGLDKTPKLPSLAVDLSIMPAVRDRIKLAKKVKQ